MYTFSFSSVYEDIVFWSQSVDYIFYSKIKQDVL